MLSRHDLIPTPRLCSILTTSWNREARQWRLLDLRCAPTRRCRAPSVRFNSSAKIIATIGRFLYTMQPNKLHKNKRQTVVMIIQTIRILLVVALILLFSTTRNNGNKNNHILHQKNRKYYTINYTISYWTRLEETRLDSTVFYCLY